MDRDAAGIWKKVSEWAGVNKDDFDAYYAGQSIAYALEITYVWEFANPPGLSILRSRFDNFIVPQSWRYVKPEEHQSFRKMERAIETGGSLGKGGHCAKKWLRKSEQGDKWNRCLIEGMIVLSETGARDEQTTPP